MYVDVMPRAAVTILFRFAKRLFKLLTSNTKFALSSLIPPRCGKAKVIEMQQQQHLQINSQALDIPNQCLRV